MRNTVLVVLIIVFVACKKDKHPPLEIVGWGDSMMKGAGGEQSILEVLSKEFGGVEYTNFGVGGLQSSSIAVLQGGLPLELVFDKKNIGIWGKATTTYYNILPFNGSTKKYRRGRLNTANGKLIRNENKENPKKTESFTFRKNISLESLELKDTLIFKFDNAILKNKALTIIWAGRNDKKAGDFIYQTRDNIQAMINHLDLESRERLLILSICNGIGDKEYKGSNAHTNITRLNALLEDSFGEYFIDIRTYMVNNAIYDIGITPTEQDLEDISKDCIPRSLLNDHVHFNTLGYEATGKYLAQIIRDKGWIN